MNQCLGRALNISKWCDSTTEAVKMGPVLGRVLGEDIQLDKYFNMVWFNHKVGPVELWGRWAPWSYGAPISKVISPHFRPCIFGHSVGLYNPTYSNRAHLGPCTNFSQFAPTEVLKKQPRSSSAH